MKKLKEKKIVESGQKKKYKNKEKYKKNKPLDLLTYLTAGRECYALALELQKSKDINSTSEVRRILHYSLFSDFPPKSVASVNSELRQV